MRRPSPAHAGRGVVALAAATAALLLTGTVTAPADADTPSQVTLPDPNPGPAPSGGIAANAALTIPLRVYLTGRNPKREAATALAVSDRRGPAYAHYLTPDRFQQVFGPSAAQVDEVSDWLTSEGIKITATSYHYITVSATVARVDAALDTQITAYPIPIQ